MDAQAPADRHEESNTTTTTTQSSNKFDTPTSSSAKFDVLTPDTKDAAVSKKTKNKTHKCKHCKACKDGTTSDTESSDSESSDSSSDDSDAKREAKKERARRHKKALKRKSRSRVVEVSSSSESDSDSSSSSESGSEADKRKARQRKSTKKTGKKSKKAEADSDADESSSGSSSSEDKDSSDDDQGSKRKKKGKKAQKQRKNKAESDEEAAESDDDDSQSGSDKKKSGKRGKGSRGKKKAKKSEPNSDDDSKAKKSKSRSSKKKEKKRASSKGKKMEFRRVDQLWDSSIHNYKLKESAEDEEIEFDEYIFTVRRTFDWENKYKCTFVDIKSKLLRNALQEIMKDVKSVSLVEDEPAIDPNMLFLYLEESRTFMKKTLKARAKAEKKRKARKRISETRLQLKILIDYLDQDYKTTKKSLYPMLKEGTITFEYLWALFKPNCLAYTTTYGTVEHPRCFKVDYATKDSSYLRGQWYSIEGRYLEYDGKSYGLGDFEVQIDEFKGPRKIVNLTAFPLEYHKDPVGLKKQLIERGKEFTSLQGMNYRYHKGLAFMKKKKAVLKVNINGRIMIDPALFRRINPNYPISIVRPADPDDGCSDDEDDDDCSCCAGSSNDEAEEGNGTIDDDAAGEEKTKLKVMYDKDEPYVIRVPVDEDGDEIKPENIEQLPLSADEADNTVQRTFTEEELLISSPVVLGFAFAEKMWLEFSLSGVCDIEWNEGAFDSLVLPAKQKAIVKALVSSHKFHAAKTIDDVIQGKGRGLVSILHGPPGTGKTLTAEGIAELLKCPLYMVSAGELGTDPAKLEYELQKILDIAHSWGAVLLLDEADVFLEQREIHDIHRNALVSIFLRLLEYFQGILFLTTNRVNTFDEAFQSRIHVALRYEELTAKAKKSVWKMFLDKVQKMEGLEARQTSDPASSSTTTANDPEVKENAAAVTNFSDKDIEALARRNLNGRQIKNVTRTAQAMAVNDGVRLTMEHIKQVLDVAESFAQDLQGGTGYSEAMRSYT